MKKNLILLIAIFVIGEVVGIKASELISSNRFLYNENQTVEVALNSLFSELQDGKELLAESITAKGVDTTSDSTLEEMAYNISNINNSIEWKLVGSANGKTEISLANIEFRELNILHYFGSVCFTYHILKEDLTSEARNFRNGSYNGYNNSGSVMRVSLDKVLPDLFNISGTDNLSSSVTMVYYR